MKSNRGRSAALFALKCGAAAPALLFAGAVHAQDAASTDTAATSDTGDIIVTARRRDESLQDVPATVNAVTNEAIQKLNLQNFKDIQAVVPGLVLSGGVSGSDTEFSLRGASFNTLGQNASPTVQFYINEAPMDTNMVFQSMFDVGQIEVLRGPQGTLRGKSAPSGAITLTTRRANVDEVGGYLNLTGTTRGGINANGAVNVPIIPGVLAIRVSGLVDHNDLDGIRSVNNGASPFSKTDAVRVSLAFTPTDTIDLNVMAQRMNTNFHSYQQVAGFSAGFAPLFPVGGPVIRPEDRLAVSEGFRATGSRYDMITMNANWRFAGQKLSYVGAYSEQTNRALTPQDPYNAFPGFESYQDITPSGAKYWRHEVRLASEERIAGLFDYTVGVYRETGYGFASGVIAPSNPFNPITVYLANDVDASELSYFGTATLHLSDRTEITAGARHITFKTAQEEPYNTFGSGNSICLISAIPIPGFTPGVPLCPPVADPVPREDSHVVWNASVSHKFSDDFLVYGNIGTSFRARFNVVAFNDLDPAGFASIRDLYRKPPETSQGEEIGFKATFFDKRARLNVAAYHQKFKDYSFYLTDIRFLDLSQGSVTSANFTATADAVVWGVDVDAAFQLTPNFSMSAGFSWSKGTVANDVIPCNDPNLTTAAQFTAAGVLVARCNSNRSISTAPRWSLTLQSEYSKPISEHVSGFVRGLFSYYPDNPYRSESVTIGNYALLNLYAGIRSPDDAWEVSLFAKNATNTSRLLSQSNVPPPAGGFVPVNYRSVSFTSRREFGLNVRYAFGSR